MSPSIFFDSKKVKTEQGNVQDDRDLEIIQQDCLLCFVYNLDFGFYHVVVKTLFVKQNPLSYSTLIPIFSLRVLRQMHCMTK